MFNLCISELSDIIEGTVRLGAMPPLAGQFEPIGRIVADVQRLQNRDVLWMFESPACGSFQAEDAYARGALGVIVTDRVIEPWAGKFSVSVADSVKALHRLMRCLRAEDGRWPESVFGTDEATQGLMQAVWHEDTEAISSIISCLHQRATSVA